MRSRSPWRSRIWRALIFTFLLSRSFCFFPYNFRIYMFGRGFSPSPSPQNFPELSGLQYIYSSERNLPNKALLSSFHRNSTFSECLNCIRASLLIWYHNTGCIKRAKRIDKCHCGVKTLYFIHFPTPHCHAAF